MEFLHSSKHKEAEKQQAAALGKYKCCCLYCIIAMRLLNNQFKKCLFFSVYCGFLLLNETLFPLQE